MTEMSLIDGVLLVMIIASVVSFIKFLIGGYLLYNVVLVSAIQHESAISIHISPPSSPSLTTPPSNPTPLSHYRTLG